MTLKIDINKEVYKKLSKKEGFVANEMIFFCKDESEIPVITVYGGKDFDCDLLVQIIGMRDGVEEFENLAIPKPNHKERVDAIYELIKQDIIKVQNLTKMRLC